MHYYIIIVCDYSSKALHKLYIALIRPRLDQVCTPVWSPHHSKDINKSEAVQNLLLECHSGGSGVGTRGARGVTGPPPPQYFIRGGGLAPLIIRLDIKSLCMYSSNFHHNIKLSS